MSSSHPPSSAPALRQNIRVGVTALFANPLRTVLSTLGVIIGVASLVAVLSVGDGMERTIRAQLEETTSVQFFNVAAVTTEEVDGQDFPLDSFPVFTVADVRDAARLPGLVGMTAEVAGRAEASDSAGNVRRMVSVTGVTESWSTLSPVTPLAGQLLSATDIDAINPPRVVLSQALASRFATGASLPGAAAMLGRTIRLEGRSFLVSGVISDSSTTEAAWVSLSAVDSALPPSARPRSVLLVGKIALVEEADSVKARVTQWADARFGTGTTRLRSNESRLAQAAQGILMFKLFMGAITGISLLVGGIGIMNVLLASVTERTREIGIRKAMGARKRDVLWQFLAESVAVASLGSGLGVVLGLAGAYTITAVMRSQLEGMQIFASVSWSTIAVAVLSALFVGLVFGTYPARRAARLDPIDAIRHE